MDFFYPNWINDHWRIEGLVFYADRDYFVDAAHKTFRLEVIKAHCSSRGIAFYDTATAVRRLRDNASDKFLEVVESTDIPRLIAPLEALQAIVTTGEKATETICRRMEVPRMPAVGEAVCIPGTTLELYRLPSSSRAYPLSLEKKAEAYKLMFRRYGLV
jgi:G:T/U-mismatch repair DNA glycosylase